MPRYEYRCTECGESLEAVQSFTDAPLTVCPECNGELRKVFSAVGVVFKGSGFYRTDSRSSNNGKTATIPKSDAAKSDSKSESSSSESSKSESAKSGSAPKTESKSDSSSRSSKSNTPAKTASPA